MRCLALVGGQVAEPAQDLLQRVAVLGERVGMQVLERALDLLERLGVDQLAQLLLRRAARESRSRSSARAAARRSAFGVSPSYM